MSIRLTMIITRDDCGKQTNDSNCLLAEKPARQRSHEMHKGCWSKYPVIVAIIIGNISCYIGSNPPYLVTHGNNPADWSVEAKGLILLHTLSSCPINSDLDASMLLRFYVRRLEGRQLPLKQYVFHSALLCYPAWCIIIYSHIPYSR